MIKTPRTAWIYRIGRVMRAPLLSLVLLTAAISATLPIRAGATDETATPTPSTAILDIETMTPELPTPELPTIELLTPTALITDTSTITETMTPTAIITDTGIITETTMPTASPTLEPPTPEPPTPTPTAIITDTAVPPASPSGEAMPVGDLPGWKQIFTEDFTTNASLSAFPGAAYKGKFTIYQDGWKDTAGQRGAPSRYFPSKVISVQNGMLNKYLHTENGMPVGAAILPIVPGDTRGQLYGKYSVRFRADSMRGFKAAWLLWPDLGGNRQYGEIDWPESDYASTMNGFMHHTDAISGGDQDSFKSNVTYTEWHTASIEWTPGKVVFILDGRVIGTSTTRVPSTPLHWVLQSEACLPTCPAPETAGNVQIDWMTIYAPTGEVFAGE